jgi:RNA-directed DNA polymerase
MSDDRHLTIHNLGLLQRQAGVDPEVAELVVAYGRLLVDSGQRLQFEVGSFPSGSYEQQFLSRLRENNPEVDSRFLSFLAAWNGAMERLNRKPIFTRADLAEHLGMSLAGLQAVIAHRSAYYRRKEIPKRNGGVRVIHIPCRPLRSIHNWILRSVLAGFEAPAAAHGFVRGRSIVTNAVMHQKRRIVLGVDIADFFPSVRFRAVRKGFQHLGYPYSVAVYLANLCTVGGALPQGTSTSPALANLACLRLDKRLTGLAHSLNHAYSRYADDLVFSSDDERLPSILPFLREILAEEGFYLAEHKTKIYRAGHRQTVTGIVVNERATLSREQVRRMRAAIHRLRTNGAQAVRFPSKRTGKGDHDPVKVLEGHLAFLKMIHSTRAHALLRNLGTKSISSYVQSRPPALS